MTPLNHESKNLLASQPVKFEALLSVDDLTWIAGSRALLNDIQFKVPKGIMLGIIGPNGAGKSSLLRCLYRYIKPQSGVIRLNDIDIYQFSHKTFARKIAVVQQDTPQQITLTTYQLVTMGLAPHKGLFEFTSNTDKNIIMDALERVGLLAKANDLFEHLSGGEKQRALIARAIVQQPELLILDEPTNHLDIRYQIQILELVKSLGITVIASIHDLNLASAFCDKLLMLEQGVVIAKGTPSEVLTESRLSDVFGVCASIESHPQHGKPLINYFYGYTQDFLNQPFAK